MTDSSNNLASVPSSSTPNSFVYRDSSGNSSVNELTISGLSANEFLMTNGSSQISSSNTIPFNNILFQNTTNSSNSLQINNAFSQNVLTVDTTAGGLLNTTARILVGGKTFFEDQASLNPGIALLFNNNGGYWVALANQNSGALTIYNPSFGTPLNIYPGYKGASITPGFTTYAMPNSGPGYSSATHYFENNFEIAGTLTLDSLSAGVAQINGSNQLISSNTIASPTFTGTITTSLTASSIIQTNASSQLTASNTLHNTTMTGTMNMSAINTGAGSAQSFVTLDGSGNAYITNQVPFASNYPNPYFSSVPTGTGTKMLMLDSSNQAVTNTTLVSGLTVPTPTLQQQDFCSQLPTILLIWDPVEQGTARDIFTHHLISTTLLVQGIGASSTLEDSMQGTSLAC